MRLWFDVEKRHKTIQSGNGETAGLLWFDVEKRHKTMRRH